MAIKSRSLKREFFTVLFFLIPALYVQAQEPEYFVDSNPRLVQRITWNDDEYARRYEVIIEKKEESEYQELMREFTSVSLIDISLPPGEYRCRVVPYDYLDRPGESSQWVIFEILPAMLNIEIIPMGDISISDTEPSIKDPIENLAEDIIELPPILMIIDTEDTTEDFSSQGNYFLSASWGVPQFPLYGNRSRSLNAAAIRFGMVSHGQSFGFEAAVSWNNFASGASHSLALDANLLAQKWLAGARAALRIRLGIGYTFFLGSDFTFPELQALHTNVGFSFLYLITECFFMEGGIDHTNWFTEKPSGSFQPWIAIGLRF